MATLCTAEMGVALHVTPYEIARVCQNDSSQKEEVQNTWESKNCLDHSCWLL